MIIEGEDFDSRSLEEMDRFIQEYLREYPYAGYSTKVEVIVSWSNEENNLNYQVRCERMESCD